MPLKYHLVIISVIIVAIFSAWKLANYGAEAPAPAPVSDRAIQVVRANWGANCRGRMPVNQAAQPSGAYAYGSAQDPLRENNVLEAASAICNGKLQCEVRNSAERLGPDPAPDCFDKRLEIEYRCFSYDRLWQVSANPREAAQIDCNKK